MAWDHRRAAGPWEKESSGVGASMGGEAEGSGISGSCGVEGQGGTYRGGDASLISGSSGRTVAFFLAIPFLSEDVRTTLACPCLLHVNCIHWGQSLGYIQSGVDVGELVRVPRAPCHYVPHSLDCGDVV